MREPLEKEIQKDILVYLQLEGIYAWTNKTQGTYDPIRKAFRANNTKKGVGDILALVGHGRFTSIEVKRKGGKVSPEQKAFIKDITDRGGIAFVAYSVKDAQDGLRQFGVKLAIDLQKSTPPSNEVAP